MTEYNNNEPLPSIEILLGELKQFNTFRPPSVLYLSHQSPENKVIFDSILSIVRYASERGYIQRSTKITNNMQLFYARLYRAGLECCIHFCPDLKSKLLRIELNDFESYLIELDDLMNKYI